MSRIIREQADDEGITFIKTYYKIIEVFESCKLFPTDIERVISQYINCDEKIHVTKRDAKGDYECLCGAKTQLVTFGINYQYINGQKISMTLIIGIGGNKIHYAFLEYITQNVAEVIMGRGAETYQMSAMMNLFMKRHYNKLNYINQENCYHKPYNVFIGPNMLISYEGGEFEGIKVINKRLFKNIIVIVKRIIDNFKFTDVE